MRDLDDGTTTQSKPGGREQGTKARALYSYKAQQEEELNLEAGDIVDVLDLSSDWWTCTIGDNRGLVPSSYFQVLGWEEMAQAMDKPQESQEEEELYESADGGLSSEHQYEALPDVVGIVGKIEELGPEEEEVGYDQLVPSYKKSSFSGEWKEEPLREVIVSKVDGISEEEWSEKKLYNDIDEYFHRFESSDVDTKSKVEQKLLMEILPSLEKECRKSEYHSDRIYHILAKLCCCQLSKQTVKHSLYLLRRLLTKDKIDGSNALTIFNIEKILRGSFSKDGLFKFEAIAAQQLRLTVYSKVLCLLAFCHCKGFLTAQSIESEERQDAKVLLENLKKCFSENCYKKKDVLHHAAELTLTGLKWIFDENQPVDQLAKALDFFKKLSSSDSPSEQEVSKLVKKLCGCEWSSLHVTLCCMEHEMRSSQKALTLLLRIAKRETKKPDWKFFTSVSGILSNATMTNKYRDIRETAGSALVEYLQDKNLKNREVKKAIERKINRVLFSPDPVVRTSLARVLSPRSNESISAEQTMNYLCWFYRSQALERKKKIRATQKELVYMGSFLGQKVAIKTMRPSMRDLARHELGEMELSIKSAFIKEAYFLRRLHEDAKENNIIRLLCCDSERIPYHLVTEFFANGNLLEYLRHECRSETSLRRLANLSKWCLDILKALAFLLKNKIVHKKIMARSVFVADDEVCKLSGFSAAEEIMEAKSDVLMYSSGIAQLDSPEIVRWLAPEVLRAGFYSKASDVWAFGVLMYEVFSLGFKPCVLGPDQRTNDDDRQFLELILSGKHLHKLPCFDDKIYSLMEKCWMMRPSDRIPVKQLRHDLFKLQQEMLRKDARMPAKPPDVFPEVKPQDEEDASRRLKVLKDFLQSKQEEAFTVNVVKTAAATSSKCFSLSGQEEDKDIDTLLTGPKRDSTLTRKHAPLSAKPPAPAPRKVKPPGEVGTPKAPRVFRELKPKKEASSGNFSTTAATTSSLSTSGGEDASTDALVPDEATTTSL